MRSRLRNPSSSSVDVTDAPRKIIHAVETMPITPGEHTLVYPKWIPGEHGPTGPIDDLTGLVFTANGQQIPWRRDDVDMYAFHIDVPAGATELKIKLDFLATASATGYSSGASTSASLAMLSWNTVVLYPEGANASDVMVTPSAKIPQGWQYGTALTKKSGGSYDPAFETVSLEQLVDSPLLSGTLLPRVAASAGGDAEALSGCGGGWAGRSGDQAGYAGRLQQPGA